MTLLNHMLNDKWWSVLLQVKGMKPGQKAATYTLCGGDVHVAADEGQTVVHAHLEINHPETKQHTHTHTHMHTAQVSSVSSSRPTANMSEAIYLVWSFSSLSSVCLIRMMSFGHLHNITSQRRLQTVKWFAQSENLLDKPSANNHKT